MFKALTGFFLFYTLFIQAQIVSKFTWDSNPVTTSIIGPNAISAGSSATSSPGGVGGTNGLNPGSPLTDINMHIPNTGNVFDIPNIDISIDYRRNESTAQMIRRANFTFNNGDNAGTFQVKYKVGAAGTVITSTAVNIPSDLTYRNYRFTYDNCSGIGTMYVNNSVVWSSPTPTANLNLYWVGEGDIVIGQDMDGTGNNIPNLDNFILQPFTCTTLPINLTSFTGIKQGDHNLLKWVTAANNTEAFILERSSNGFDWQTLQTVYENATSTAYQTFDNEPGNLLNYYRLKQQDHTGNFIYSAVIFIDNSNSKGIKIIKTVDMLGREINADDESLRLIYYSDGTVVKKTGK